MSSDIYLSDYQWKMLPEKEQDEIESLVLSSDFDGDWRRLAFSNKKNRQSAVHILKRFGVIVEVE
jgi:hypothetical protein